MRGITAELGREQKRRKKVDGRRVERPTELHGRDDLNDAPNLNTSQPCLLDFICFKMADESLDMVNCIGILKGLAFNSTSSDKESITLAAVLLCIPEGCHCVDLSLYKVQRYLLIPSPALIGVSHHRRQKLTWTPANSVPPPPALTTCNSSLSISAAVASAKGPPPPLLNGRRRLC
ncbi:Anaphase-promoting complex subunit 4 [Platanthera zijinensis]|uniref:Anaphase-promoting complex subunit 4 n=1 Tax=Platanthera zijinensis TaxID=2320716 RepID=A0AAP0C056_9ASPA